MIIIDVTKFSSIEQALKVYKNKHNKIGTVRELRDRQVFTKPSVKRRAEIKKAVYIEKKFNNNLSLVFILALFFFVALTRIIYVKTHTHNGLVIYMHLNLLKM